MALILFLVAQAASLLGARAILRGVRSGDPALDLLQFLLLRLLLISTAVLAAGLLGGLAALPLGLASAVALGLLLAGGAHRGIRRPRLPDVGPWIAVAAGLVALRLALQVWFFAPHLGDAVAYHLPKVAEWVQAGGFTREMGLHPHVTFPAGFELVETWWVVFLRHDVLIEAAGVEFLALAAAAVYVLGRRVGLDERGSALAALIVVLGPGLHLSATSCLNDAPAAAMVLATAALVSARASRAMIATAAGLALGIKPTAGFALPGLLLWAWMTRAEPRARSGAAWGAAATAAIVGGFWYVRNLAWFGNPFHPLGGTGGENPVAVQFGPRWASLPENLGELLSGRMLDEAAAAGANADYGAGWGAPAVALGLIGLVSQLRDEPRLRAPAAGFLASLVTALLFVRNDPWCLKYVLFFPALLALAAAGWSRRSRGAAALAAAALAFSFAGTCLPYDLPLDSVRRLAARPAASRSALESWADDVPENEVGCAGGFEARAYLLYRPDFSRRVRYVRPPLGSAGPDVLYSESPPESTGWIPAGRHVFRRLP